MSSEHSRKLIVLVAIWVVLLFAPYWMAPLGGYTALATRVLVLGLAAMSLNFLLGFTGVLSFGHAAYFGLGAYGAGLSLKYLAASTPLAAALRHPARRPLRRHPRRPDRAAARRLFRHGHHRVRPGVLLHRLPVELGDRRRRRPARLCTRADRPRLPQARHPRQRQPVLLLRAVLLRARGRRHGFHPALAVRTHHDRDPRERAPLALPRHTRSSGTSGLRSRCPASSWALPARCTR